nr:protein kinase [Nanoarchaeota archaeon]
MIDDTLNKEDELPKGYVLGGRYIIDKLIGKGGMANVYSADDKNLDRTVALKILHKKCSLNKQFVERFKREAKSAARLSHDNIVTVYDAGETDGKLFISMERVKGKTIDKRIEEQKTFCPLKEACTIISKALKTLE